MNLGYLLYGKILLSVFSQAIKQKLKDANSDINQLNWVLMQIHVCIPNTSSAALSAYTKHGKHVTYKQPHTLRTTCNRAVNQLTYNKREYISNQLQVTRSLAV